MREGWAEAWCFRKPGFVPYGWPRLAVCCIEAKAGCVLHRGHGWLCAAYIPVAWLCAVWVAKAGCVLYRGHGWQCAA